MMVAGWLSLVIYGLVIVMNSQVNAGTNVSITFLESAVPKGAVCLDGSAPAYSYAEGSGDGANNWIVYLVGGGWCLTVPQCLERANSNLGSSRLFGTETTFTGMLDLNCTINPDFCNWHKVYIYYCDGASFMANVETVDPNTNLTYRGGRIFDVMMEEMLAKGLANAHDAILAGTSAGGLATMLHCDKFRKLVPNSRVKCISDSGFFIHRQGHLGGGRKEYYFSNVIKTHELASSLPPTCTSKMNSSFCLFPEYFVEDIQTPLFILESGFDQFQIGYQVLINTTCSLSFASCTPTEIDIMKDYRMTLINALEQRVNSSSTRGFFVHSCYLHDHILREDEWTCLSVANKVMRQVVGDWYFDRSPFREIDPNDSPRDCTNAFCGQVK